MKITVEITESEARSLLETLSDATYEPYEPTEHQECVRLHRKFKRVINNARKPKPLPKAVAAELAKDYPRVAALGLAIHQEPCCHVKRQDMIKLLRDAGMLTRFHKAFGTQTQYVEGPFPWDVERALERLAAGRPARRTSP